MTLIDSADHASSACYAVNVTYTNQQPPILTIQDAIDKKSFFPKPADDIVAGDAEGIVLYDFITGLFNFLLIRNKKNCCLRPYIVFMF